MTTRLLFVHALSPLHAGTGQSLGAVDLAIARDRATGMPYLPGSSLKGSLRARAAESKLEKLHAIFGPETSNASDHAGALVVGDANLLLLPVRSVAGTFAWVTSPLLLDRFARDARECGVKDVPVPRPGSVEEAFVAKDSSLLAGERVIFEDLDFKSKKSDQVDALAKLVGGHLFAGKENDAWRTSLSKRLCVVHDDAMSFLAQHATDVVTRVSIDNDTKTVNDGQLWQEELLPTETVLVSMLGVLNNGKARPEEVLHGVGELAKRPIQLGGKATVGRGRCQLVLAGGGAQ